MIPASLPVARTPDPTAAPSLRWGVIGTGWIADRFVASLVTHSSQRVVAVGSRAQPTAQAFADRHSIRRAYGSYEELVNDADVDVVYVATPHNMHLPVALLPSVWWPTSVSGSPTTTGSCGPSWLAAHSWIWAPISSRSLRTCSVRSPRSRRRGSGCRPVSWGR